MTDSENKAKCFAGIGSVDTKPMTEAEEESFWDEHADAVDVLLEYMKTGVARTQDGEVLYISKKALTH